MAKLKLPTEEQQRLSEKSKERRGVKRDIQAIEDALESGDEEKILALHKFIDNQYQAAIVDWGKSMLGHSDKIGFNYELLDAESRRENLVSMKSKLEGFIKGLNDKREFANQTNVPAVSVAISNSNTININISFEEARQKIEDMPGLDDRETEEIKSKIDELEDISKEEISKKKKWEKVKPILAFAMDKGADVAICIMSLILQMKLGV